MALRSLLSDLAGQTATELEIVVADAGSTDGTAAVAKSFGVPVVEAPRGRGSQMNAGRRAVDAPWLLFLHADSRLPEAGILERAMAAIQASNGACGHFPLKFRSEDPRLRFLEAKSTLSRPFTINGDQGLLVPAGLFDELGGFDESLGFLEDQRFCEKARAAGVRWVTLPDVITTSARRFEAEGFRPRYFAMAIIMAAWAGGADEFFVAAPAAYRPSPSTPLDVAELLRALRVANRQMGLRRSIAVWLAAARFARSNAWQLFFAADVALAGDLGDAEHPFLDLFDSRVAPLIDNRVVDVAVAASAYGVLTRILPAALTAQRGANWVRMRIRTPKTTTATAT